VKVTFSHWHEPAPRLIWIYAVAIGAFYGTIQTVPLLLKARLGITEQNVGFFVMYLGGMGVIIRALILGRVVDWLGEGRLSRVGLVLLGGGLVLTGLAHGLPVLLLGFTLMPLGTAFLFPCVTGLLSRVVGAGERGLYMGVQHTFGGISRVAFPIASGILMDHADVGVPFLGAGLLVFLTIPLARRIIAVAEPEVQPEVLLSAADITGEIPIPSLQDTPNRS